MAWAVEFEPRAFHELKKPDRTVQRRIVEFLQGRLTGDRDPRSVGKALTGDQAGLWRYRVAAYRVVCEIDDGRRVVLVLRIAHRKDVYR